MSKKCKMLCGIVLGTVMLAGVTGCGSQTSTGSASSSGTASSAASSENVFTYEDESEEAPVSTSLMARVESIDGNQITLAVGGGKGGNRGGKRSDDGTASEKGEIPEGTEMPEGMTPPGDGEAPEDMTPPGDGEAPEGMTPPGDGEVPEGTEMPEAPSGDQKAPDGGQMEQKSAVLTVGDESVITIANRSEEGEAEETSGSLSDIEEGSMLMIAFDESGNITGITVSKRMEKTDNSSDTAQTL